MLKPGADSGRPELEEMSAKERSAQRVAADARTGTPRGLGAGDVEEGEGGEDGALGTNRTTGDLQWCQLDADADADASIVNEAETHPIHAVQTNKDAPEKSGNVGVDRVETHAASSDGSRGRTMKRNNPLYATMRPGGGMLGGGGSRSATVRVLEADHGSVPKASAEMMNESESGQWKETVVALDSTVLIFHHPQAGLRIVDLTGDVTAELVDDVPIGGSCSVHIRLESRTGIYFFADTEAETAQWCDWIQDAMAAADDVSSVDAGSARLPSTKPPPSEVLERFSITTDEMVPPWLATELGGAVAGSLAPTHESTPSFTSMSFDVQPTRLRPSMSDQSAFSDEVEELTSPNIISESSCTLGHASPAEEMEELTSPTKEELTSPCVITSTLSVRRSLCHRASFAEDDADINSALTNARSSFRGLNVSTPGVGLVIPVWDEAAERADVIAEAVGEVNPVIVLHECDERVGDMEDGHDGDTVVYLERETTQMREVMDTMSTIADGETASGFSKKYESMEMIGWGQDAEECEKEVNMHKNRYANIVTYDHTRVHLDVINGDPDSTYISANWMDGYNKKRAYIATQGPVPQSFISFWRMLWQYEVEVIVMVSHEMEKGRMKCHRYWPDPSSHPPVKQLRYGAIIVTHVLTQVHKHYALRVFELAIGEAKRTVKQYAYLSWPDHGVPFSTSELLGFRNAAKAGRTDLSKPLCVHCSAGVGRTGTYLAIDRLLEQCFNQATLDVELVVTENRLSRNFMVQTEIQYYFIYRAVFDAITELYAEETAKAALREQRRPSQLIKQRETVERAEAAAVAAQEAAEAEARDIEDAKQCLEEERCRLALETPAGVRLSVTDAQAVIQTSIKDRIKFLGEAEERWLDSYRVSVEEWQDRNQSLHEDYDVTTVLTPIQSRLAALRQRGLLT